MKHVYDLIYEALVEEYGADFVSSDTFDTIEVINEDTNTGYLITIDVTT